MVYFHLVFIDYIREKQQELLDDSNIADTDIAEINVSVKDCAEFLIGKYSLSQRAYNATRKVLMKRVQSFLGLFVYHTCIPFTPVHFLRVRQV